MRDAIREAIRLYGHEGDLVMVEGKGWRVWIEPVAAVDIRIDARAVSDDDGIQCRDDVLMGVTAQMEETIAATIMHATRRLGGRA